ncbi:uncharacterized protein BO87DRAFT_455648 [Aspergillus neoniger CBS 115656]|uniref:Uncharacterized protein n=1 Tax=Aspergillus neoniger (strain CBS 115656) TaxID=1448310 RepID=A0A318Z2L9_ASPNB|nr:hypothetical protein BO87DRAFT_455648 [Aspergillus neoniger CBS 115656]PYH38050.1 hypothetical protein BO87DRAFT_455648 [Aspergillus neoniger CBS 115656]
MFKATARSLYQLIGKTRLGDLPPEWQAPVGQVLDAEEKSDPRFKNAEIRGSKPHASHDDPTNPKEVVSVRIKDDGLKTFRRLHIHQDGSVKRIDV